MLLHRVEDTAVLAEFDSLEQVMAAQDLLRRTAPPGVADVVAGAHTVLVRCDAPATVRAVRAVLEDAVLRGAGLAQSPPLPGRSHTIKTVYDGDDLAEAARLTGLSTEALVSWHCGQQWRAAFGGFAPGFMYLSPAVQVLAIPRRSSPRTVVPAGSVAVGGEFSAIYPGPSPGGWQLLGRCAERLWDSSAVPPSLILPSDSVQFRAVRELVRIAPAPATPTPAFVGSALRVLSPGPFTTVQDLGRPGFAHLGVTASGALDRAALRRANRMVGNTSAAPGAAGLETVLAGLALQAIGTHVVAVAGQSVQLGIKQIDGSERAAPVNAPTLLLDGETLTILSAPAAENSHPAVRSYLAVRGGFAMSAVLGSRATDVLSGLGPDALRSGMVLPVAPPAGIVGSPEAAPPPPPDPTVLRFRQGPRHDWFMPESLIRFENQLWRTSPDSNRVGLRLEPADPDGKGVARTKQATAWELPSEGMADGAIQVPPSGMPVLFLADHPVTGGYPVLGVVCRADLDKAAALAPGARVRFRRICTGGDVPG